MVRAQDAHAMAQLPPSQQSGQISPDGRWGMVDAYQGAQRWNARHGIIS